MTGGGSWIAASVRARSLAHGRLGPGGVHAVLTAPDRERGLQVAAASLYHDLVDLADPADLADLADLATARRDPAAVEHQIGDALLWRLRVLAGWLPPGGTGVLRSIAAYFERENILRRARALHNIAAEETDEAGDYVLGGLASSWAAASRARDDAALRSALAASPWGDPVDVDPVTLADTLTLAAWRRLVAVAPITRPWARDAAVLLAARLKVIEHGTPTDRQRALAAPLIGREWASATDLDELRASLAPSARTSVDGVDGPDELWRAESALVARIDDGAVRMLRVARPGPDVVLAAAATLMVDGWRLRAALTAVGDPAAVTEVHDVVA